MRTKMAILAMLAAGTLCAQTPSKVWTLDECIGYALEHNIEIKRQELGVDNSEIGLSESRWDYAPSLSAGSSYSISSGRVLDRPHTSSLRTTWWEAAAHPCPEACRSSRE